MYLRFIAVGFPLFLGSCSSVPSFEATTGKNQNESKLFVKDIVVRVKCELADAFNQKVNDSRFAWLDDWTVKSELTLQVATQAGLAPSGSFTDYHKSAINYASGPTLFPGTALQRVQQFFMVSASATLNESALRTEVLDFTVSMKELKSWKSGSLECNPAGQSELLGNLGLRDWVDSVLVPIDYHALEAGSHPQPGAPKPASVSKPMFVEAPTLREFLSCDALNEKSKAKNELNDALLQLISIEDEAKSADDDLASFHKTYNMYECVLPENTKRKYEKRFQLIKNKENLLMSLKQEISDDVTIGRGLVYTLKTQCKSGSPAVQSKTAALLSSQIPQFVEYVYSQKPCINPDQEGKCKRNRSLNSLISDFNTASSDISHLTKDLKAIDPPIDSLLHTVQFTLNYGAGLSPTWSLLQWKGPTSGSNSLISGSGQRIHTLQITAGPVAGSNNTILSDQLTRDTLRRVVGQTP